MQFNELKGESRSIDFGKYCENKNFFNSKIFKNRSEKGPDYFSDYQTNLKIKNISEIYDENFKSSLKLKDYQLEFDILKSKINKLNVLVNNKKEEFSSLSPYIQRNGKLENTKIQLRNGRDEGRQAIYFKSKFLRESERNKDLDKNNKAFSLTKCHSSLSVDMHENSTLVSSFNKSNKFNVSIERVNNFELQGRNPIEGIEELVNDILTLRQDIASDNKSSLTKNKEIIILTDKNSKIQSKIQILPNFSPTSIFSKYNHYSTNRKDKTLIRLLKEIKSCNYMDEEEIHHSHRSNEKQFNFSDFSFSRENNLLSQLDNKNRSSTKKMIIISNKKFKEEDEEGESDNANNIFKNEEIRASVENMIKKSLNFSEAEEMDNFTISENPYHNPFNAAVSTINKCNMEENFSELDPNVEFKLSSSNNISLSTSRSRKRVSFQEDSPAVYSYDNKKALKNFYINAKGIRLKKRKANKSILKERSMGSYSDFDIASECMSDNNGFNEKFLALERLNKLIQECEVEEGKSNVSNKNTSKHAVNNTNSIIKKRNSTPDIVNERKFNGGHKYCRKFEENPLRFFTKPPPQNYLRSLSLESAQITKNVRK